MLTAAAIVSGMELSPLQLRAIFRAAGHTSVPPDTQMLSAGECLQVWAAMLVTRLKFLDHAQQALLTEELAAGIVLLGDLIVREDFTQTPMVVIADSRYATWHHRTGWLDLVNGETVPAPPYPPLETVGYNLAVLFRRNLAACRKVSTNGSARHT